ncbi:DUF1127 domain-containing protein [Hoeflea sp. 108]|jgi:uncharacterized protein YjiS (DUF1127 family)|uniref:DUF1127 domain-containing protein n=1 Tax=Hoeflea sp. 108 TaxID=1116369 RepID=UPI000A2EE537|nr:DUF1127 domain-containing protein [Hoeflea sp. 108]
MSPGKFIKLDYLFGLKSFWRALMRWADRANQRRDLAELERDRLDDLGISPEACRRECEKPFWRK